MRLLPLLIGILILFAVAPVCGQGDWSALVISEFVPNQVGDLETEWIELYNGTAGIINLRTYQLGDALVLRRISDTDLYLPAHGYIVLAQDPTRFLRYYTDFDGMLTAPMSWSILNNDGDTIRLAYQTTTIVDTVVYAGGFPDNRSWERFITSDGISYWGESFSPTGSTPGKPNTYFYPRTASIDIDITPNPFSPNGDGFEDVTVIKYNPPESDNFELTIYDISGRKIKTFFESDLALPGEITWDGRGDDGRVLDVGIYILYARIEGDVSMSSKRTVVLAR